MAAPPSALLLLAAAAAASANTFIQFLGRGTAQPSQPPTSQPPAPRRRLSDDDIKKLLRGRDALVLAASDTALGLSVAEGLTDVGARVILVCREPKRVQRACDRMTARWCARALWLLASAARGAPALALGVRGEERTDAERCRLPHLCARR